MLQSKCFIYIYANIFELFFKHSCLFFNSSDFATNINFHLITSSFYVKRYFFHSSASNLMWFNFHFPLFWVPIRQEELDGVCIWFDCLFSNLRSYQFIICLHLPVNDLLHWFGLCYLFLNSVPNRTFKKGIFDLICCYASMFVKRIRKIRFCL